MVAALAMGIADQRVIGHAMGNDDRTEIVLPTADVLMVRRVRVIVALKGTVLATANDVRKPIVRETVSDVLSRVPKVVRLVAKTVKTKTTSRATKSERTKLDSTR